MVAQIQFCCGTWIRTKITAFRELRPTISRSRNICNLLAESAKLGKLSIKNTLKSDIKQAPVGMNRKAPNIRRRASCCFTTNNLAPHLLNQWPSDEQSDETERPPAAVHDDEFKTNRVDRRAHDRSKYEQDLSYRMTLLTTYPHKKENHRWRALPDEYQEHSKSSPYCSC